MCRVEGHAAVVRDETKVSRRVCSCFFFSFRFVLREETEAGGGGRETSCVRMMTFLVVWTDARAAIDFEQPFLLS